MIHQIKRPPLAGSGVTALTPKSYTAHNSQTTDIWAAGVAFAERRAAAEHELLGAIMASVAIGVAIAESEGITQRHFQQPDLSVIFAVASLEHPSNKHPAEQAKLEVLRLSRIALRRLGYWDDSQIAGNVGAMRWSDASLARLACSWPFSPHAIRHHARELVWMDCQQRLARAHYNACLAILEGSVAA